VRQTIGQRVIIIGGSGSGKSTLGEQLAQRLGRPFIELDALHWEPDWVPATEAIFRARISAATAAEAWIMAGNYTSKQQHISWPLADTIVWLDLPLMMVLWRVSWRTGRRVFLREELWNGNRENLRNALSVWNPDRSILAYMVRTHGTRRRAFAQALTDPRWSRTAFVRLRSPAEIAQWLETVTTATAHVATSDRLTEQAIEDQLG